MSPRKVRSRTLSTKSLENLQLNYVPESPTPPTTPAKRKSIRKIKPSRRYTVGYELPVSSKRSDQSTDEDLSNVTDNDEFLIKTNKHILTEDTDEIPGSVMFQFRTPKKRDGMLNLASSASKMYATPAKTPKTSKTSKSLKNVLKTTMTSSTPTSIKSKSPSETIKNGGTPPSGRLRRSAFNKALRKRYVDTESDFSADDSCYEPSDESSDTCSTDKESNSKSDSETETLVNNNQYRKSIQNTVTKTPVTRSKERLMKQTDFVLQSDEYFSGYTNKGHTSNHTLNLLKTPRIPQDQLSKLLGKMKISVEHETAIANLHKQNKEYFSKWLFLLNEGFSILLYGLGSKKNLLETFHKDVLDKEPVLVVHGFFPSVTIKDILMTIANGLLELTLHGLSLHEIVNIIEKEFQAVPDQHLFLLVHNIDGIALRNADAQDLLSRLAKISNIHLIASMDHINTPLLWDNKKLCNFNFSFWDTTTMLPYTEETSFENSLLCETSGKLTLSSMNNVYNSLTSNSRGIFMILVNYQIANKKVANYQGISFENFYWNCREAFLVSSDLTLRAQLTEFLDHRLIKMKRTSDGVEHILIPIEDNLLQQFKDQQITL